MTCPYGLPQVATFYQGILSPLNQREMELFLAAGYRRNGNWLYTMHCRTCAACLSIRLQVPLFSPNRNQRRTLKRNCDVSVEIRPLMMAREHLQLCEKFLCARFPGEEHNAEKYFRDFFISTVTTSQLVEYRLGETLIGAAVIDFGDNWMNAVYFYFDPDLGRRSPGTFNILKLIELCAEKGIDYLYLGYHIEEISSMRYKRHFRPCQLLLGERWYSMTS